MIAEIRRAGVTSNAGFATATSGAMRTPRMCVTSSAERSSMGICSPDGNREIESGNRRGHVKRHVVFVRQHGDLVRADLVGGVAVGGDAVRADDDGADVSLSS